MTVFVYLRDSRLYKQAKFNFNFIRKQPIVL